MGAMRDGCGTWHRIGRVRAATFLVLVPLLAACGAGDPDPSGGSRSAPAEPTLYAANATVLEIPDHGPELCLGVVADSLPPQCGGVPLIGWRWDAVEGEESLDGTTWGDYRVVGRYEGKTFTVVDVEAPQPADEEQAADPDFTPPCPEPVGGWRVPDPEHNTQDGVDAAGAYAQRQAEYVASWVYHLEDMPPAYEDILESTPVVYVAVFGASAERHEAEIRERWSGPLCVVERPDLPTEREAARIRREAEAMLDDLGLDMLWSSEGTYEQAAVIGVVLDANGDGQTAFDVRFGPGVVRVVSALQPVS